MSLTSFPCRGPLGRGATRACRGLSIAARRALYAGAFSTAGGPPRDGSPALSPATDTVPPDPMLLGTVLTLTRCGNGLPCKGAAWAALAPKISAVSITTTDGMVTRYIAITPLGKDAGPKPCDGRRFCWSWSLVLPWPSLLLECRWFWTSVVARCLSGRQCQGAGTVLVSVGRRARHSQKYTDAAKHLQSSSAKPVQPTQPSSQFRRHVDRRNKTLTLSHRLRRWQESNKPSATAHHTQIRRFAAAQSLAGCAP